MISSDAKRILRIYRPGCDDGADDQIADALELARGNMEMQRWLHQHNQVYVAMRDKFRSIPVPQDLKDRILADSKIVRPTFWTNNLWARAAAIALFIGVTISLMYVATDRQGINHFGDFRARMVRSAQREYTMELLTDNLSQVRRWMADHGAPSDFLLPDGLARLNLTGGGVLHWRNQPVTMVCFDRGDKKMLFLFVMNSAAVKDPPAAIPQVSRVSRLESASWTKGDKTYVLAGPEEQNFSSKYLH